MSLTIYQNSDGVFRVKVGNRWLLDEDLMIMISSNHRSEVLNFFSREDAQDAINQYNSIPRSLIGMKEEVLKKEPLPVKDDFKKD